MIENCSFEIQAMLRFYKGRKLISTRDIIEFSETWQRNQIIVSGGEINGDTITFRIKQPAQNKVPVWPEVSKFMESKNG